MEDFWLLFSQIFKSISSSSSGISFIHWDVALGCIRHDFLKQTPGDLPAVKNHDPPPITSNRILWCLLQLAFVLWQKYLVGANVIAVSDHECYIIIARFKHIFINQNMNHYSQHVFANKNKFVCSCSVKICALQFNKLLKNIFCLLLVLEGFSLQKVVEMLEEVIVIWWKVRWLWGLPWWLRW